MKFSANSVWANNICPQKHEDIMHITEKYDVAVIGAGHAGCEAALACARMGLKTIMFTVSLDSVAFMPCNPNVGGTSKGHLVKEIDALGGEMGRNTDRTFIQSKMLNRSKGPAVHSLRAQADKQAYSANMRRVVENTENLYLKQSEVSEIITENGVCKGIKTVSGAEYLCKAVILCSGVYLNACCVYGEVRQYTGPNGLMAATKLTDSLIKNGIEILRFKTGTPARIDGRTVDFSKMEEQKGDEKITPFSFSTDRETLLKNRVSCWLTYTTEETHEIIRANIDRSPLYKGDIKAAGPRHCPSIEDKVVKFPDKDRHQVFIEPEGLYTNEMYISGMSSSLPEDVQYAMYRSVPGLENVVIVRNAYAIEYDCINPMQLKPTLEFKKIKGLYSAGQANGSSGYEEAAAQGIIAGINAALKIKNEKPLIIDRSEAYIGVLIDDLLTKETREPYRMMTSRAEYRLLLRQDNADLRLRKYGYRVGLISRNEYDRLIQKEKMISLEIQRLENTFAGENEEVQNRLKQYSSALLTSGASFAELIKRPELDYEKISPIDKDRPQLPEDVCEQVNIQIKYEGYIKRQKAQVEQFKKTEKRLIPEDIDYDDIKSLRIEAVQKLKAFKPANMGQASRIQGVSPADLSVLAVYISAMAADKESGKNRSKEGKTGDKIV